MNKKYKIGFFFFIFFAISCKAKHNLKNTEWLTVKFTIDSVNYLSELDKNVYLNFDTSTKLYAKFLDTIALIYLEGALVDTSNYTIINDTLFFIQGDLRDTSIILKLTRDSFIHQRLAGAKTYSVRNKRQ